MRDGLFRPFATATAMAQNSINIDLTGDTSASDGEGPVLPNHSHIRSIVPSRRDVLHSLNGSPNSRTKSPGNRPQTTGRGPISPPPLRRSSASFTSQSDHFSSIIVPRSISPSLDAQHARGMNRSSSGVDAFNRLSQQMTPPSTSHLPKARQPVKTTTPPKLQTPKKTDWNVTKIIDSLTSFRQDIKDGHAELAAYAIQSTVAKERRVLSGSDLFVNVNKNPVTEEKDVTMRVKFKVS